MMGVYAQSEAGTAGESRSSAMNGTTVVQAAWDPECGFTRPRVSSHSEHWCITKTTVMLSRLPRPTWDAILTPQMDWVAMRMT